MSKVWASYGASLLCLLASVLGLLAVAISGPADGPAVSGEHYFLEAVARGVEGFGPATVGLLGLAGFIPGALGRVGSLFIGVCTVALLPLVSGIDMLIRPGTHNLLPLEWACYLLMAIPAALGARAGRAFASTVWVPGQQ